MARRPPRRLPRLPLWVPALLLTLTLLVIGGLRWLAPPPVTLGGPYRLTDGAGQTITDRDFPGRYQLIYFGYTNCPDICPTVLGAITRALALPAAAGLKVQPIFITIDPARDSPAIMAAYVRQFSPDLVGLTGPPAEIARVRREFHVYMKVVPGGGKGAYGIDHGALLYVMAPGGGLVGTIAADATADTIAARLADLLRRRNIARQAS